MPFWEFGRVRSSVVCGSPQRKWADITVAGANCSDPDVSKLTGGPTCGGGGDGSGFGNGSSVSTTDPWELLLAVFWFAANGQTSAEYVPRVRTPPGAECTAS